MVVVIPKGVYTMKIRFVIINENAKIYQKASKKVKAQMLDELTHILHINRQYLALLLSKAGKVVTRKKKVVVVCDPSLKELSKKGRKRFYGGDIERALKKIWSLTGFTSSKHLVGFIRLSHEILFEHPEIKSIFEKTKRLLLRISHSTVYRLLKPYRHKIKLKRRYRGNPYSSKLRHRLLIMAFIKSKTAKIQKAKPDLITQKMKK